ncbi:MAG: ATP-binding cassette domain-containing protein [Phycisphaeraceae bacterium]|nr:ATP-binding cassette domain-containing protein [Phycisphaeraceae bacterium]
MPDAQQTHQSSFAGTSDASSLRRVLIVLRPYFMKLAIVFVVMMALTGVNLTVPYCIGLLFNNVFPSKASPEGNPKLLWLILLGMIVIYGARNALFFHFKYAVVEIGENFCFTLRNKLFEHLQQLNLSFFRQHNAGKISSKVMNDSYVIQQFIQDDLPKLLQAVFMFLCIMIIIFMVNWPLALASTVVLPIHLFVYYRFRVPIKRAGKDAAEQLSIVHGNLIEKFLGVEVVKGFSAEERENQAFVRAIDISRKSQLQSKTYIVFQKITADMLIGVGTVSLIGFGAYQVLKKPDPLNPQNVPMLAGTFIMFFAYIKMLYPTVIDLMGGLAKFTRATASIDRVFEMLDLEDVEVQPHSQALKPDIRGHIAFKDVSFSYGDSKDVLKKVTFKVRPGQVCAIVGASGAGKSTLVGLVPRFQNVTSGTIEIDGLKLHEIDLNHLRSQMGIVFQECFLFNSTVLENLRYAKPDASMRQIIDVAQRTGAHDFIQKLPDGYDTILGENGMTLSRGEKQRLTLARAMLRNPKILILDEATASIDSASEAQIVPAILQFMHGKTTLMITHRPELLRHADMVVHLEEGYVSYQGPPDMFSHQDFRTEAQQQAQTPAPGPELNTQDPNTQDPSQDEDARESSGTWQSLRSIAWVGLMLGLLFCNPGMPKAIAQNTAPNAIFEPMVGMNDLEAAELLDVVEARLTAQGYFGRVTKALRKRMPSLEGYRQTRLLAKTDQKGVHLIQLGYKVFKSQPLHLWVAAATVAPEGKLTPMDLTALKKVLAESRKSMAARQGAMKIADLAINKIRLSYIEPDRCMAMLKTLGYQVIEYKSGPKGPGGYQTINPNKPVDPKKLPIVVAMPGTDATNLVGGAKATKGQFGLTMTPSIASDLKNHTSAAPMMELMVLSDESRPQQYARLLELIRNTIDVPARQILIEAMVLEVAQTSLDELGIQWELQTPRNAISNLRLGRLPAFSATDPAALSLGLTDVFGEFSVKLEALVTSNKAKILSRPSILTLDNRQASIRVGEEIPVATSVTGASNSDKVSFNFKYIPIGILLNVRPRVTADGENVSLQIDAIVSSQVPGESLELRDVNTGQLLASAPRISTRRVQTYSRVANNTPFIIGGLVAEDDVELESKIPLLGDLPILGALFKRSSKKRLKREVIIVITPYVLAADEYAGRNMPKDEDSFDSFGNELFRDAYRIRSEDVFDLTFLLKNLGLQRLQSLSEQAVSKNASLADMYPFDRFSRSRIPGERIIVYRQMYEVIKRRRIQDQVNLQKLISFKPQTDLAQTQMDVSFVWPQIHQLLGLPKPPRPDGEDRGDPDTTALFNALGDRAIALTWTVQRYGRGGAELLAQPVPQIKLVDCPDRKTWSNLLWEMNQPGKKDGKQRYTILIHDQRDLVRLKRAIVIKHTVNLNAKESELSLKNFSVGRLLLMPMVKRDKVYLVDDQVAKYFFFSELYYPAMRGELQRDAEALQNILRDGALGRLLDDPGEVDRPAQWVPDH